jgi:hypothetical protein
LVSAFNGSISSLFSVRARDNRSSVMLLQARNRATKPRLAASRLQRFQPTLDLAPLTGYPVAQDLSRLQLCHNQNRPPGSRQFESVRPSHVLASAPANQAGRSDN